MAYSFAACSTQKQQIKKLTNRFQPIIQQIRNICRETSALLSISCVKTIFHSQIFSEERVYDNETKHAVS